GVFDAWLVGVGVGVSTVSCSEQGPKWSSSWPACVVPFSLKWPPGPKTALGAMVMVSKWVVPSNPAAWQIVILPCASRVGVTKSAKPGLDPRPNACDTTITRPTATNESPMVGKRVHAGRSMLSPERTGLRPVQARSEDGTPHSSLRRVADTHMPAPITCQKACRTDGLRGRSRAGSAVPPETLRGSPRFKGGG